MLGHLVDGRGGKDVGGAERPKEPLREKIDAVAVRHRIAEHGADRLAPMPFDNRHQSAFDFGKGLVPGRGFKAAVSTDHRRAEPIRIVVQIGDRNTLRTDVAFRKRIGIRATNRQHASLFVGHLEAAAGLTKRTDPVARFDGHGSPPDPATYSRVCGKSRLCTRLNKPGVLR